MKRLLLVSGMAAAMLVVASSSFAAGVNLLWNNCFGEGLGTNNRTFACASNAGTNLLVVSFVPGPGGVVQTSGIEIVMDFLSAANPLPAWWDMRDPLSCRPAALTANTVQNANDVVCLDWSLGAASGGIGAYNTEIGTIDPGLTAQHRRLKLASAVPQGGIQDLTENTEYFAFNVLVNNTKTVGTGNCTGCADPICIVLNSVNVVSPVVANNRLLSDANTAGSNTVTWQGVGPNCLLVPTKNATWGRVKALYR